MDLEEFGKLFTSFQSSAFRLEAREIYTVDEEAETLELFLSGQPLRPDPDRAWTQVVASAIAAGKTMARVHLVTGPLTPYLRYEFEWGYPYNSHAGEQIYILEHPAPSELFGNLPRDDFWLFDDNVVVVVNYDDEGRFLGADKVTDPDNLERYRATRDVALREAVSFSEYLARQRNA
jgi:hypothetical protein